MAQDHNMKVGDRFQIGYDPEADPDRIFGFLKTAWFEVVEVGSTGIKCKRIDQ